MGWFGRSSPSTVSPVKEIRKEPETQQYLEDLPPKFEDSGDEQRVEATYREAIRRVSLSDFTVSRYVGMPCFREAMLTGFQAMGVLGVVTFLVHKNVRKTVNWSVCGFFLGSVIGWEQCRSVRRRSFQVMEKARSVNQDKNLKKWQEKTGEEDENLAKFQLFQNKSN